MDVTKPRGLGTSQVKRFADTKAAGGKWDTTHVALVDKNLIIHTAQPITTQYGDAYVCDVEFAGNRLAVLMGGVVLVDQIGRMIDELPVSCRLETQKNYYLLVEAHDPGKDTNKK